MGVCWIMMSLIWNHLYFHSLLEFLFKTADKGVNCAIQLSMGGHNWNLELDSLILFNCFEKQGATVAWSLWNPSVQGFGITTVVCLLQYCNFCMTLERDGLECSCNGYCSIAILSNFESISEWEFHRRQAALGKYSFCHIHIKLLDFMINPVEI